MHDRRWITIALGLAVVIAAAIGWRGSRPTSPIATTHSDGVTVVPATGTLRREETRPAAPSTTNSPAAPTPPAVEPQSYGIGDVDKIAADFKAEPRDPSWAPGTEAGLRAAFASLPDLAGPVDVDCRTGLCRLIARVPEGLGPDRTDQAAAMLQARSSAQNRADRPFGGSVATTARNEETGATVYTVFLTRR